MGPKKDTEAARKAATNKKAAATRKTAATASKKTTIEMSSDEPSEVRGSLMRISKRDERWLTEAQNDEEAPKTKPTKKVAANKKDPKRRRNSDSEDEREGRDKRRPKKQKQNKCRVDDCEEYALRDHQDFCKTHGPGGDDDQTIYRSDEEPAEENCREIGCYHKAVTDWLRKTHAKNTNQGTLDDGSSEETFRSACQEEGCGRFTLQATPRWCNIHGPNEKPDDDGSTDDGLPKQTARKSVSKAPEATPKAAPKTKKAPAPAATRDGKCQRTTLANKLCTRNALSKSQYCAQHQKPTKTAPHNNDDYIDSDDDGDQDDDKDTGKKKVPTRKILPLKKTATKSNTTTASAKKGAPAKVPDSKPAAQNKTVGEDERCGITTGKGTACERIPAAGKERCFQHKSRAKDVEVELQNEVIMLEATIIEESGCLLDDGLEGEMTIHDTVEVSGYVSA